MNGADPSEADLSVEGIGGIDACEVTLEAGVTVLSGTNATNRTSLLRALTGVLGGSAATIKGGRDEASVSLAVGGDTYTRSYRRRDGTVVADGDPYTDETELIDLFAALLEDNPVRRAVERGDDLADVLMRPVDTAEIERRIDEKRRERDRVADRIAEIERERKRLPDLEERRRELQTEREDVEAEIERVQAAVDAVDRDVETAEAAEEAMDELEALREDLEEARRAIETQRSSIEALREEREGIVSELAEISLPSDGADDVEERRAALRERERSLSSTIDRLSGIVEFSEGLLDDELDEFRADDAGVAADLDPASRLVECWTCGTEVPRGEIADELDELRGKVASLREEREEVRDRLDECQRRAKAIRERRERKRRLESRREEVGAEIERRERRIVDEKERADGIRDRIAEVEDRIEGTEELRDNDLVEGYQRLSQLEYRHGQLEQQLCSLEAEIEDLRAAADERDRLAERRSVLAEEIESLRTHIQDVEAEVVENFNRHVSEVISLLDYENVERVWIERTATGEAGADPTSVSEFRLHVVRSTADDTVYEDRIGTLSESEREVIGLVVALAGYLAHDVYECVPFLLLDSLEAIDADRIARLVDYVSEFSTFLVVALLAEDARAIDDDHRHISAAELRPTAD